MPLLNSNELDYLCDGRHIPVTVSLEVINRCNVKCRMCEGAAKVAVNGLQPYYCLSPADVSSMFEGMIIDGVTFAGAYSEPLLNKHLIDIIKSLKANGTKVHVMTNLTVMNPMIAVQAVINKVDTIYVSLHGSDKETAESIMPGANFEVIVESLRNINFLKKNLSKKKPVVAITMVLMRRNLGNILPMITLAHEVGAEVHLMILKAPSESEDIKDTSFFAEEELFSVRGSLKPAISNAISWARELNVPLRLCQTLQHL